MKSPRRIQSRRGTALACVWRRLSGRQRQQGRGGRTCVPVYAGSPAAAEGTGRFASGALLLRYLLFAVFVKCVHDVVQALIYDLTVASHHRH